MRIYKLGTYNVKTTEERAFLFSPLVISIYGIPINPLGFSDEITIKVGDTEIKRNTIVNGNYSTLTIDLQELMKASFKNELTINAPTNRFLGGYIISLKVSTFVLNIPYLVTWGAYNPLNTWQVDFDFPLIRGRKYVMSAASSESELIIYSDSGEEVILDREDVYIPDSKYGNIEVTGYGIGNKEILWRGIWQNGCADNIFIRWVDQHANFWGFEFKKKELTSTAATTQEVQRFPTDTEDSYSQLSVVSRSVNRKLSLYATGLSKEVYNVLCTLITSPIVEMQRPDISGNNFVTVRVKTNEYKSPAKHSNTFSVDIELPDFIQSL